MTYSCRNARKLTAHQKEVKKPKYYNASLIALSIRTLFEDKMFC